MSKPGAEILESKVICKQPGHYIGWPTINRTPADDLVVVFSGERDAHVCPFGKTVFMRSSDNGRTWTEPRIITDTPLDDRDAGILACADGTLIVSWFTAYCDMATRGLYTKGEQRERWLAKVSSITPDEIAYWGCPPNEAEDVPRGHWIRRSTDDGATWEAPIRVPPTAPHGPIELADGRLLFVGNSGYDRVNRTSSLVAAESCDKGRTWTVLAHINMFPDVELPDGVELAYFGEPHVVEASPGRLVAVTRYEEKPYMEGANRCRLWQFNSEDGGHTWTEPYCIGILGKPPHLTKLADGRLLVTYGYRHVPFGERACFSYDGGDTWDYANEIVLRDDAPDSDLGYPATVEAADGTLVTVYYQVDQPGERTCLMMTRWRADG